MTVYCIYDDLAGLLGICETIESAKYKAALFNADAIVEQELETAVDKDRHTNSNKIVYQVNDRIFLAFNKAEQYAIAKDASIKPIKFSDWAKSRTEEDNINVCGLYI